jgi:serine protease
VPAGASGLKFVTSGGSGDADLYVRFGAQPTTTSFTCKSEGPTNAETCNIATAQAGTYHVLVRGYSAFSGLSLTGSHGTGGGGSQTYSSGTDVAIPDNRTVESPIAVSGRTGNGAVSTPVTVAIVHTFRGDLRIELVAPDGSVYLLKNYNSADSADNVNATYNVNLSGEALNGTWKLRVTDNAVNDTGRIDSWSISF